MSLQSCIHGLQSFAGELFPGLLPRLLLFQLLLMVAMLVFWLCSPGSWSLLSTFVTLRLIPGLLPPLDFRYSYISLKHFITNDNPCRLVFQVFYLLLLIISSIFLIICRLMTTVADQVMIMTT